MNDDATEINRVKFYGVADAATYWQAERIVEVITRFEADAALASVNDAIELHNVQLYIESGILPTSYSEAERAATAALFPRFRAAVAKFFFTINDTNVATQLTEIADVYRSDLLDLLGRNKAFERCNAETMLPALIAAGIHLNEMLDSKKLVAAYDKHVREVLIADVRNAEHLIRRYLQRDESSNTHLPKSLTPSDIGQLLSNYLDDSGANLNLVRLVTTTPVNLQFGVDAKLKLKAKRRSDRMVEELFRENPGFKTGVKIGISETQDEPVIEKVDDMVLTITYSRNWLDGSLDNASILNNFQHLFGFTDDHVLLTLPSYPAELGVFERFMPTGRKDYHTGSAFRAKDSSSLLQTHLYRDYLSSQAMDLEAVIAWFFSEYLIEEFGAPNFTYSPSARASSYLEKARHLFAEMEGLANQFRLYVQDGEVDRELLALTSDPVAYNEIPSLVDGKYVHATDHEDVRGVLHTLFSDQSRLKYINATLRGSSAAELLIQNEVAYTDFHEHQRSSVDQLIKLGVLEDTGPRVQFANPEQLFVLHSLFEKQGAQYHHLSPAGRAQVDALEDRGWVTRRASLLTKSEASYFNYFLNKAEFSNGPELRNKYVHGSQPISESEGEHFRTYVTALRLIIALIIKMNDDFCLSKMNQGPILAVQEARDPKGMRGR